ncbi:hypothetical protein D3C85_1318630 [compost metagenome]
MDFMGDLLLVKVGIQQADLATGEHVHYRGLDPGVGAGDQQRGARGLTSLEQLTVGFDEDGQSQHRILAKGDGNSAGVCQ